MTAEWSEATCEACGAVTQEDVVTVTLWPAGELVLIEDVPAQVCRDCGGRFFDQQVGARIQKLAQGGFAGRLAARHITIPVYAWPRPAPEDEAA